MANSRGVCFPTPYKHWENKKYCHIHGGDVDETHTSAACGKPGPRHNPKASHANIMGGLIAKIHKTILPLACSRLRLISAPSSSSSSRSNVRPFPTTHLEARPGSNQPLPHSLAECHWPAAPTARGQPWPCRFISLAKE
jgi:hypothetical protein